MRSLLGDYVLQHLQNEQSGALHSRLFRCLRHAIVNGVVQSNTRLPASRDLAQEIHVSRNTVLSAYDQLQAEGYVEAKTGHGTWVSSNIPDTFLSSLLDKISQKEEKSKDAQYEISQRGQFLVENAAASPYQWGAFVPGVPDVTAFPHHIFQRIQTKLSKSPQVEQLIYSHEGGCLSLRLALAQYLKVSRSVSCDANQIIITEGIHQGIDLITRLLADVGDIAWVEEPGYWGVKNNLHVNGVAVEPIPIDDEGLCLPIESNQTLPKLIFVTPSHQYPLGSHLSLQRRKQLINFAHENQSWIVEDDYDSEFRFSGQPYPSLQGLEKNSPVIYMGTFSKTIYPALRIGYVVVPKNLALILRQAATELYRGGHTLLQNTLAEFIEEGHYEAHIRRMRLLYAKRRKYLIDLIFKYLGGTFLHEYDNASGLHLVLKLSKEIDDVALSQYAIQQGVKVRPLSQYYINKNIAERGLLLGFACVDEKQMFDAFHLLRQCLKKFNVNIVESV
ncbi:PLP-dependent aminotransferase family protein [Acinetobacter nectaris]|uniref:MocR-like pyridoxine biosynthesis transcription factor PdxR n=1 Tax=Acinetobacter nectaris TaxID=1219382 RepID=UPI001F387DD5|nr:PLP-dependent aminotransferase family protein [Acinetobacter nectaris]MCF9046087.1 PLP-dependent aminotransferase family protein [Acinetobacter nectaris]